MKKIVVGLFLTMSAMMVFSHSALADSLRNPSVKEIKQMIADEAREQGIPPEVLKAIAAVETNFQQFDQDGKPIISADGGIGIMQVTPKNIDVPVDEERLATDIAYNISIAANVLHNKWDRTYLPKINNHDKTVIEDWYFVIMAYNGLSSVNDPSKHPGSTYQEKVYQRIERSSLVYGSRKHFDFPAFDIRYEEGNETMFFAPNKDYETETSTPSQQMYKQGDIVYIDARDGSVNLRENPGNGSATKLWPYTPLKITSAPEEPSRKSNDYAYYRLEGVTAEGYVASAYLNQGNEDLLFTDPVDDKRAAALSYATLNGYIKGYDNGSFGSRDPLRREHVAVILTNMLSLSAPDEYQMKADDVKKDHLYYEQLKNVEYNELLGSGGKLRPKEHFTRAQMAQVMTDAFEEYYDAPTISHVFKDQEHIWNPEAVNTIYFNDVTVADPFEPHKDITRSQFVLFIYRTMVDF